MKINNIIEKVLGYVLLIPAIYSLLVFGFYHLDIQIGAESEWVRKSYGAWFGWLDSRAEHTNTTVIYFGLLAIAGVYLIKDNKK